MGLFDFIKKKLFGKTKKVEDSKKVEKKIVIESELHQFDGNREKIRMKATEVALRGIENRLKFSKST